MEFVHVFGPRDSGDPPTLAERFCRPGAAFGPAYVEWNLGVRVVFHEDCEHKIGAFWRCRTCSLTGPK